MRLWIYKGPAFRFSKFIGDFDLATLAETKPQAASQIQFQIKKAVNLELNTKITIDEDKLQPIDGSGGGSGGSGAATPAEQNNKENKQEAEDYEQLSFFEALDRQLFTGNLSKEEATEQAIELARKNPNSYFCYGWLDKKAKKPEFFTPFYVEDSYLPILDRSKKQLYVYKYDTY